ncbi:MAG: hypothetical protein AB1450_04880 [Pseudomonadota bacterium]
MNDLERDELKRRVRVLLEDRVGPDECINMYQLYHAATGRQIIPLRRVDQTRQIRTVIAELQEDGLAIVHKAGNEGGYYIAADKADIEREAAWFRKRAMAALRREKMLRRISTEELLRQLRIEFDM